MKLVKTTLSRAELKEMASRMFGDLVKAVVDIKKDLMIIDAELHADEEAFLIAKGSKRLDLWGINLYPDIEDDNWIEFDSMINLKPGLGNRTRGVDDPETQQKIIALVKKKISP